MLRVPVEKTSASNAAIGGIVVFTPLHFRDAAQYVTEIGQPAVFVVAEISKSWYDSLPADLQKIVDDDAAAQQTAIAPIASEVVEKSRKGWTDAGGELISLPADEQAAMMKTFASAVAEVTAPKPKLDEAYKLVFDTAQRLQ